MKVLKFGGTSVGTPSRIQSIENILKQYYQNENLIIVVSAFSKVTDQLLKLADLALEKNENFTKEIEALEKRHLEAIDELFEESDLKTEVQNFLKEKIESLKELLNGIFLLNELSAKSRDKVVSFGELMSSYIIANYFSTKFNQVKWIDSRKVISTDSTFEKALVDFAVTEKNAKTEIIANGINLMGGFIGSNEDGQTTTLGRGGSDYTAAIMAAVLDAEELNIYTDVSGVLTSDPRKVKKSFPLKQLSYEEAMELSHFGAKVIYPPTIQPVYRKNIPLWIKNTMHPEDAGTVINNDLSEGKIVKGITSISNVALVRLEGAGMVGVAGISGKLFNALAKEGKNVILISQASSEHSICFAVEENVADEVEKIVNTEFEYEIRNGFINKCVIEKDVVIIAVVGSQMNSYVGVSGRLFQLMGKNGINVKAIAQGSSELNISAVIDLKDEIKALNVIHDGMFLSDEQSLNVFIVGTGLIGSTLLNQIKNQAQNLKEKKSLEIKIVGITNTRKMQIDFNGIDLQNWETQLNENGEQANLETFVNKMIEENLPNTIFIDNTASEVPIPFYKQILKESISIITPNKIAKTQSATFNTDLENICKKSGAKFLYETNVGAGLPIISTLRDLMQSGDKVNKIEAILSGSLSYIFNNFDSTKQFSEIVAKAKDLGFTEPDPRIDLSGKDVARKVLILARETGMDIELTDIEIENILPKTCLEANTIEAFFEALQNSNDTFTNLVKQAEENEKVLRFMAEIKDGKARVYLNKVDKSDPFYNLSGSDNMVVFTTQRYNERPLVVKGPGAGAEVTAAGVFAELINIGDYLV